MSIPTSHPQHGHPLHHLRHRQRRENQNHVYLVSYFLFQPFMLNLPAQPKINNTWLTNAFTINFVSSTRCFIQFKIIKKCAHQQTTEPAKSENNWWEKSENAAWSEKVIEICSAVLWVFFPKQYNERWCEGKKGKSIFIKLLLGFPPLLKMSILSHHFGHKDVVWVHGTMENLKFRGGWWFFMHRSIFNYAENRENSKRFDTFVQFIEYCWISP